GSTAPYTVTPLDGIKNKAGPAVSVQYSSGKDVPAAIALAKSSDIAIVCVGNNPNLSNAWTRVSDDSEGRESVDRQSITLGSGQADVLFGDYNPAGRLCQTWPASLDQIPPMMDYDIRHGRTYMYFKGQPLYPFGYGLSYTTFKYSDLKASTKTLSQDGTARVSVKVRNTGKVAGEEVVQLYVKHLQSKVQRPMKELRGFRRVAIAPGETKIV